MSDPQLQELTISSAPYDKTFRKDGNLCFLAEVPALAHIGERFEELCGGSQTPPSAGPKTKSEDVPVRGLPAVPPDAGSYLVSQFVQPLELLKRSGKDPELLRQMAAAYSQQMEAFRLDGLVSEEVFAGWRQFMSSIPSIDQQQDQPDEGDEGMADTSPVPGRLLFVCGQGKSVSKGQIALFQQFLDQQEQLRPQIENALRKMHAEVQATDPWEVANDRALFPGTPDQSDIPLRCFAIARVNLDPAQGGRIVLDLQTPFGHLEEHGCHVLIRKGKVERYGTWDNVFGDEDL